MSTTSDITFEYGEHEYKLPERHYSHRVQDAVFFYGGWASNFADGPFEIRDYNGIVYLDANFTPDEKPIEGSHRLVAQGSHLREYETVEHYFAANKTCSRIEHDRIADQAGPWAAKKAGRRTLLRVDWEDVKYNVMLAGLRAKFSPDHPEYRAALLATRDRFIAEDSPTDYVWGIRDRQGGYTGDNLLGKALMQIRDEIRGDDDNGDD